MLSKRDYKSSSWRLKFNHAENYRRELNSLLDEMDRSFPPSIELESWNGKTIRYRITTHQKPELHWSLLLGDCLHNYRSSLDSLYFAIIFELAKRQQKEFTENFEHSIQFPIHKKELKFNELKEILEFGTDQLKEDLKTHQPFNNVDSNSENYDELLENHPLEQLRKLSNIDKHRQLNLVQSFMDDFALFHNQGIQIIRGRSLNIKHNPLQYIYEFDVEGGLPEDRIEIIPRFTLGIITPKGNLPRNSIQNVLALISGLISDYIHKLEYHLDNDLGFPLK